MKHNLRMAFLSLLLVLTLVFNQSYLEIQTLMTQKLWIIYAFFSMILPYVTLFLRRNNERCRLKTNSSSSAAVSCCASMTPNMSRKSSAIWKTSSGRKR